MGAPARIIAALVALAFATQAGAQTSCGTCTTPVVYENNPATLTVFVTATVGGRCSFLTAPSGSHDEPNFDDHSWTHDFTFTLDCTGPSRVAVVSTNGGLKTGGSAPVGYTTLAPYDVALNVVRNAGAPVTASCAAATLSTGGGCSFIGPVSTTQGLYVPTSSTNQVGSYLRVSAPAYAGASQLVSGNYADTLTVTVSAAP